MSAMRVGLFFISLVICTLEVSGQPYIPQRCNIFKRVPCVCQDERGNYVDLRPLAFINDTARFNQVEQKVPGEDKNFLFSWNPCFGFSEGNFMCDDVAVCRMAYDLKYYEDIGRQYTARFSHFDNGNLSLEYTSKDNSSVTIVSLYCDEKHDAIFRVNPGHFTEEDRDTYWLQLWSKYSCPRNSLPNTDMMRREHAVTLDLDTSAPTTPAPPSVVTMTSKPDPDLQETNIILFCILLVTACILVAMVSNFIIKALRRRQKEEYAEYYLLPSYDADDTK